MNICIIGSGHVGLVTGACFADLGNKVICVDSDKEKIKNLKKGVMPIYEPGLEGLVRRNAKEGRLQFTVDVKEGVKKSEVIFIAVSTPSKDTGEIDLRFIESVARDVAAALPSYRLIVSKSTVAVKTGEKIEETIKTFNKRGIKFDVASNPEFLREGSAIKDFMSPDRIVIGVESKKAREILTELYKPIDAPLIVTDIKSSELIKHASNSFLAMKISFINGIANICDNVGADVTEVAKGMGFDKRIGKDFLCAGAGFGGSCFPKDLSAFIRVSEETGYDFSILKEVQNVNEAQKKFLIKKMKEVLWNLPGKTAAVLGLAFKPDTDDIRKAPALDIIAMLLGEGVKVKAYDPVAMTGVKAVFKSKVKFCKDAYEACADSDCLILMTEWNEFKDLDFKKIKKTMKQPVIIDGRNVYDPAEMKSLGFRYMGIGRR